MKNDCLTVLRAVGDLQSSRVSLNADHPEGELFDSYDASDNKYPPSIAANNPTKQEFVEELINWRTKNPREINRKTKYLWVVTENTIKILLENTVNQKAARGCVCHTNLTGYGSARIGGELWFVKTETDDSISVYFNFKSGRYPASEILTQKEKIKSLLTCVGYENPTFIEDEIRI